MPECSNCGNKYPGKLIKVTDIHNPHCTECGKDLTAASNRGLEWIDFSTDVFMHIEFYAVPQYGDSPNDQAASFTLDEIQMNMKRYLNRMTTGQRGQEEQLRDMYKIAHYSCMAAILIKKGESK